MKAYYLPRAVQFPGHGTHTSFVEGVGGVESLTCSKDGIATVKLKNKRGEIATVRASGGTYFESKETDNGSL